MEHYPTLLLVTRRGIANSRVENDILYVVLDTKSWSLPREGLFYVLVRYDVKSRRAERQ